VSLLRVVTIDGAAGSGKSTLARGLAHALGFTYLNTGLMYRALTLEAVESEVNLGDGEALSALIATLRFSLDAGDPPQLSIAGSAPSPRLTGPEVEAHVSQVARHPAVRASMRTEQRRLGERGAVVEGRDMGSVVFADAPVKLYLEADPAARTARRARERASEAAGERGGGDIEQALLDRDRRDMQVNPFEPAEGAVVIDTTDLDIDGALQAALEIIGESAPELLG
jgi:cytidylate kinase